MRRLPPASLVLGRDLAVGRDCVVGWFGLVRRFVEPARQTPAPSKCALLPILRRRHILEWQKPS